MLVDMNNDTRNNLPNVAFFLFNNWINYFFVIISVLLISFSLIFLYLPKDNLIYIINIFAKIFKDGNLRDINSVINTFHRSLWIILVLGVVSSLMVVMLCYLSYLGMHSNITGHKEYKPQDDLFNLKDAIVLIYPVLFIFIMMPAITDTLWWDEAWTMRFVNGSWLNILAPDPSCNNHILSTFFIKICKTILGEKEWVIRIPALIFTFISVIAIYYLTKLMTRDYLISNITTILTTTSYGFVFCATSARGYALVMTIAILMSLLLVCQELLSESLWIKFYIILGVLSIITLPTAAIIPVGFMIAHMFNAIYEKSENVEITLSVIKGMVIILLLSSIIYAWSFPSRLMYIASRQAKVHDITSFIFVNILSVWGGLYRNYYSGVTIGILLFIGITYTFRQKRILAMYLSFIIALSIIIHVKGGYNSFWYSSIGMACVPFLLGLSLYKISAIRLFKVKQKIAYAIICLLSLNLIMGNLWSDSKILGKRSYIREIANIIKRYQDSSKIKVAVINSNESLLYYLRINDIKYKHFKSINELKHLESNDERIIIASLLSTDDKQQIIKEKILDFTGWGESYSVVFDTQNSNLYNELHFLMN
jgi:4-amino-4-deoxy-L-arabinose transferase-like glycosyltransferase